ncbi:MAG: TnpV protein [Lachnospiraceae bacterium]
MAEIQYRETGDVQLPILESGMSENKVLATLGRYGRMAARDLQETDQERYEMLLLTGMLLPKMQKAETQAEELHERIVQEYVEMWMKKENTNPYDTLQMTNLRMQAEMEAERQVIQDLIHQVR